MAKNKNNKLSAEELIKKREERELAAKKELPWILVRTISGVILLIVYILNKYKIDRLYELFDLTKNVKTLVLITGMFISFIVIIIKCANTELKEKDLKITSKTVREEKSAIKLESKKVRFVEFTKGKSWFLLLTALGIFIPSTVGLSLYLMSVVLMLWLANNKQFKTMDIMLNFTITGLMSVIMRTILI